jgi:hypothetical protein
MISRLIQEIVMKYSRNSKQRGGRNEEIADIHNGYHIHAVHWFGLCG